MQMIINGNNQNMGLNTMSSTDQSTPSPGISNTDVKSDGKLTILCNNDSNFLNNMLRIQSNVPKNLGVPAPKRCFAQNLPYLCTPLPTVVHSLSTKLRA